MRAGVGETAADGRSVAGGFGEVGRGVLEVRKLFLAITDVVNMLRMLVDEGQGEEALEHRSHLTTYNCFLRAFLHCSLTLPVRLPSYERCIYYPSASSHLLL